MSIIVLYLTLSFLFWSSVGISAEGRTVYPPGEYSPTMAIDGKGNPHIAWEKVLSDQTNDIYYSRSIDGGLTFQPAKSVFADPGDQSRACIALNSLGDPYVVWVNWETPGARVFFARSFDQGNSFAAPVRVGLITNRQDRPCIAVDSGNNPIVAWICVIGNVVHQNPLGYVVTNRSLDQGATFEAGVAVDFASSTEGFPGITLNSLGNPMVVWHDKRLKTFDVHAAKSVDGGSSFLNSVVVARHPLPLMAAGRNAISMDIHDNPVVVFWAKKNDNCSRLCLARSKDKGISFTDPQKLNKHDVTRVELPSVAVDSGNSLHISASMVFGNIRHVCYMKVDLNLNTSGTENPVVCAHLVDPVSAQSRVSLALDPDDNPHLAWHDFREGKNLIYYSKSDNEGLSFSTPIRVYN